MRLLLNGLGEPCKQRGSYTGRAVLSSDQPPGQARILKVPPLAVPGASECFLPPFCNALAGGLLGPLDQKTSKRHATQPV